MALLLILQRMLRETGTIERFFVAGDDAAAPDVGPALEAFSTRALRNGSPSSHTAECRSAQVSVTSFRARPRAAPASG